MTAAPATEDVQIAISQIRRCGNMWYPFTAVYSYNPPGAALVPSAVRSVSAGAHLPPTIS